MREKGPISFLLFMFLSIVTSERLCHKCQDLEMNRILRKEAEVLGLNDDKISLEFYDQVCFNQTQMHMVTCTHSCFELSSQKNGTILFLRNCITDLLWTSPNGLNYTEFNGKGADYSVTELGGQWTYTYCNDDMCFIDTSSFVYSYRRTWSDLVEDFISQKMLSGIRVFFLVLSGLILLVCCWFSLPMGNEHKNLAQCNVRPFPVTQTAHIDIDQIRKLQNYLYRSQVSRATEIPFERFVNEDDGAVPKSEGPIDSETSIPLSSIDLSEPN